MSPPIAAPMRRPQAETRSVVAAPSRSARPQPPSPKPKIARLPTAPLRCALYDARARGRRLLGRHVDLEPLLREFLDRPVGDRRRQRLVELGRQIRVLFAEPHALAGPKHAADQLRPDDSD